MKKVKLIIKSILSVNGVLWVIAYYLFCILFSLITEGKFVSWSDFCEANEIDKSIVKTFKLFRDSFGHYNTELIFSFIVLLLLLFQI